MDRCSRGDQAAALALELFVRRAAAGIAASASVLPVLDAVVFTGGVGEHSGPIRKRIVERSAVLGVREVTGADVREDTVLGEPNSGPTILRVEARKDVVIANGVRALIGIA